jgi:hypothetical protein
MLGRRRYVFRDGEKIEITGDPAQSRRIKGVIGDIDPYQSIVTREIIGGRAQHREHLKVHNLEEVGTEKTYNRPHIQAEPSDREIVDSIKQAARETGHDWL